MDETNHNDLMGEKYKKTCKYLNCDEHLLILVTTITGFASVFVFAALVCVPVGLRVLK